MAEEKQISKKFFLPIKLITVRTNRCQPLIYENLDCLAITILVTEGQKTKLVVELHFYPNNQNIFTIPQVTSIGTARRTGNSKLTDESRFSNRCLASKLFTIIPLVMQTLNACKLSYQVNSKFPGCPVKHKILTTTSSTFLKH